MRITTLETIYQAHQRRAVSRVVVTPGSGHLQNQAPQSVAILNRTDPSTGQVYRLFMPGLDNPDGENASLLWVL